MQHISTITVGATPVASIEFTSIPQTFTDLVVVLSGRSNRAGNVADGFLVKPNNTTPTVRYLTGDGSGAYSGTNYSGIVPAATATANTFGNTLIYFPNYAITTAHKSFSVDDVAENNATAGYQTISANLYANNAAITSIKFESINSASFVQYSSASLFGVLAGSDGIVAVS